MRVAALFDIHGNLPALEAVLEDVGRSGADTIVVGGDVLPGPMPRECLLRLLALDLPVRFIHGNGELAVLAQMAAASPDQASYWGTTSGRPLPEPMRGGYRWTAELLKSEFESTLASWPKTLEIEIEGLGRALFCHGTPRSEVEIFTRFTDEAKLAPVFEGVEASLVVCGHTHMAFDRRVGRLRVVNPGSVGQPFGDPRACWALLGPGVEFRRTAYDIARAAEEFRAAAYPQAEESARGILEPPAEQDMLALFARAEVGTTL